MSRAAKLLIAAQNTSHKYPAGSLIRMQIERQMFVLSALLISGDAQ